MARAASEAGWGRDFFGGEWEDMEIDQEYVLVFMEITHNSCFCALNNRSKENSSSILESRHELGLHL